MDSPAIIYALRWLIYDTGCQALASRLFWIMLAVSGLCTVFCLGVSIEGGELERDHQFIYEKGAKDPLTGPRTDPGKMHLMFGFMSVPLARDAAGGVRLLQVIFGMWVAGAAGILFTLVWTAGFVPEFLHPSTAAVLLAKPIPRWLFLTGKFLGVVLFVALQALIFFGATWLALGLKTDVWLGGYLAGIPLLVLHFAMFYSVSVLLGVWTRNAITCVLGSVLFWVMCLAMNYGRHALANLPTLSPEVQPPSGFTQWLVEAGYWMLPKPADLLMSLETAIDAAQDKLTLRGLPEFEAAWRTGGIDPVLGVVSGLAFTVVMLILAGMQLSKTDY